MTELPTDAFRPNAEGIGAEIDDRVRQSIEESWRLLDGPATTYRTAARLQCMSLPDGAFLLVLDGVGQHERREDLAEDLRRAVPNARTLVTSGRVDVAQPEGWADQACAMTEDGGELVGALREAYAADAARTEAWRTERASVIRAAQQLLADLDEQERCDGGTLNHDSRISADHLRATLAGVAA